MKKFRKPGLIPACAAAGLVNGLLGAGGGMILLPLLTFFAGTELSNPFPVSVAVMLPLTIVSLLVSGLPADFSWETALPCLLGSALGGIFAGIWGKKLSVLWLHRALGVLILWGGVRYLCF